MNNFIQRSITGVIFVAALLASIVIHPVACLILFGVFTMLGLWEFYRLVLKTEAKSQRVIGTILGTLLYVTTSASFLNLLPSKYLSGSLALCFLIFCTELYRKKDRPFTNIAFTLLGIVYIALPFSLLNYFASYSGLSWLGNYDPKLLLGYFFLLWANDTGAYLLGRSFGKHKLFERISPKKTWEGAIGGGILSIATAYITSLFFTSINFEQWIIISVIVVVFGNYGDLAESLFKRSIHVKDSGNLLPGHGGIMDRFDAVFISAPMVFFYLQLSS